MIHKILNIIFLTGGLLTVHAQFDNPNTYTPNGKTIGILNIPAKTKELKQPVSLEFKNDSGLKKANQQLQNKRKKEQQENSFEKEGIITKKMIALKNAKKNIEGNFKNFPMIDLDLGSFHTKSDVIYLGSYDFGRFDGDKVQIVVNGKRLHNNYLLTPKMKTFKLPLKIGINKIEVTAINEGKLSPNTGYFIFIDKDKTIIKEDQWMLAKGAKVVAIVVRDQM